jgi:hypothetical protein
MIAFKEFNYDFDSKLYHVDDLTCDGNYPWNGDLTACGLKFCSLRRRVFYFRVLPLRWQRAIAAINSLDFHQHGMRIKVCDGGSKPLTSCLAQRTHIFKTLSNWRFAARNLARLPSKKYGLVRYGEEDTIYEAHGMRMMAGESQQSLLRQSLLRQSLLRQSLLRWTSDAEQNRTNS